MQKTQEDRSKWAHVEKRASEEQTFARGVAKRGCRSIAAYFPELYDREGKCKATNTLGSDLIPDLLTSPSVVVDLYDWPAEDALIAKYGVDLAFLESLRAANLVHICANLPVSRYKNCAWLHGALAHKQTIWRSTRTPAFFNQLDPEFEERKNEREKQLLLYFEANPANASALYNRFEAAQQPDTPKKLAAILSMWIERLVAVRPEYKPSFVNFEKDAYQKIPELARLQGLEVSAYSAALGGTMKVWRHRWASLFGAEEVMALSREEIVKSRPIVSYISECRLGFASSDFKSKQTWPMTEASRQKLLDHLQHDATRHDLISAEAQMRRRLCTEQERDPTRDEIKGYVDSCDRSINQLKKVWDTIQIALPTTFGIVCNDWHAAAELGLGLFASKRLLGEPAERAMEKMIGKIQVVRLLRPNT
jgi:hypothetical protein